MTFWMIALLLWLLPAIVLAPLLLWSGLSGRRRSDHARSNRMQHSGHARK